MGGFSIKSSSMVRLIIGLIREQLRWKCMKNDLLLRLPEELMLNIISRLPVDSVLDCRQVCKTWRNLPLLRDNNTYFTDMHLCQLQQHHHPNKNSNTDTSTKLSFVLLGYKSSLYYLEYDVNDVQSSTKLSFVLFGYKSSLRHKRIKLPLPAESADTWSTSSLVGSCNGLICFCVNRLTLNTIYICNPITREFVHLPRFRIKMKQRWISTQVTGFGYHPSTNEYKIVIVYYCLDQRQFIGHVQVYTLGSGIGWRNKGETTQTLQNNTISSHGALLNGALHWISTEGNIVAFDLADVEFRCLPTPPCSSPHWHVRSKICVLDGWLCVVYGKTDIDVEIWLMKNEEKQSASSNDQSWNWSRNFTIEFDKNYPIPQPFFITKSGKILLWLLWYKWVNSIFCCDPKPAAKPKKLGDLDKAIIDTSQVISHFNSFVSLKALGENVEIL